MKKRNMILGGLLVAVAITSYAVSGTYAKYTSQIDVTDTARVAKWGMGEHTVDLFASSYKFNNNVVVQSNTCKTLANGNFINATTGEEIKDQEEADVLGICVKEDVVAPGTSGIYAFDLSKFAPETNYTIDVADNTSKDSIGKINYYVKKVSATDYKDLVDAGNANYAGIFTEATKEIGDGKPYLYVGKDITAIANALNTLAFNKVLAANTADSNVYVIGWDWAYEVDDDTTTTDKNEKDINNANDTDLGNGKITYNGTDYTDVATDDVPTYGKVELNINITASQSQKAAGATK